MYNIIQYNVFGSILFFRRQLPLECLPFHTRCNIFHQCEKHTYLKFIEPVFADLTSRQSSKIRYVPASGLMKPLRLGPRPPGAMETKDFRMQLSLTSTLKFSKVKLRWPSMAQSSKPILFILFSLSTADSLCPMSFHSNCHSGACCEPVKQTGACVHDKLFLYCFQRSVSFDSLQSLHQFAQPFIIGIRMRVPT